MTELKKQPQNPASDYIIEQNIRPGFNQQNSPKIHCYKKKYETKFITVDLIEIKHYLPLKEVKKYEYNPSFAGVLNNF